MIRPLTANKYANDFTEWKFTEWFSKQLEILQRGEVSENINITYKLTIMKPLHVASWLLDCKII